MYKYLYIALSTAMLLPSTSVVLAENANCRLDTFENAELQSRDVKPHRVQPSGPSSWADTIIMRYPEARLFAWEQTTEERRAFCGAPEPF